MMREWYSGSTSPCQGEDRGFDPRLALLLFAEVLSLTVLPLFTLHKILGTNGDSLGTTCFFAVLKRWK